MSSVTKDVLYIDVDDEITTVIDRLTSSSHKVVALVLPKRATVLQSIVNMRLLKRAADENKKHVVLVTTEKGLMPLAGAVGLHVAATPNSKPAIPRKPAGMRDETEETGLTEEDFDPKASAAAPVGTLAGVGNGDDNEETIQLDNEDKAPVPAAAGDPATKKAAKPKKGKNKKLKVPDFNAFRKKWLIIGSALVALIVLWVFAFMVLPKATIAVKTDSENIEKTLDVTFDTDADSVDSEDDVVPSVLEQTQKVSTQSAPASGQDNRGEKAKGEITISSDDDCPPNTIIPAGTGVSSGGKTFITQSNIRLGKQGPFNCVSGGTTRIVANAAGASYNLDDVDFSINGHDDLDATGTTKGGTDNIVKYITQGDIDSAKQKVSSQLDSAVQDDLAGKLEDRNLYAIRESFNTGTPEVTVSAKVGDQVDSVSVTQKTTYSMVGAQKKDIEQFITSKVNEDIDTGKQRVLNTGLDDAVFKLQNQQNNSAQVLMSMDLTALAGPKLDDSQIKEMVKGKKAGEIRSTLNNYPGVTDVEVKTSPFWVSSVPKNTSKIIITYEK